MFRTALARGARSARSVSHLRPVAATRSLSSASRQGSSGENTQSGRGYILLGGALAAATLYLTTDRVLLDAKAPKSKSKAKGPIPYSEVNKHNTPEDCWVVIGDKVYDLTAFAPNHPGGTAPIYNLAGKDATALFEPIHAPGIIEARLDPSAIIGDVDMSTVPPRPVVQDRHDDGERKISLEEIVGLPDFEEGGRRNLTSKAWDFISAGATDMYSVDLNRKSFNAILFRPRYLSDVAEVDTSTTFLGQPTSLPIFIAPTGMSGLANPIGEPGLAAAAADNDIIQMVSTNASSPLEAIISAGAGIPGAAKGSEAGQSGDEPTAQFMQLYVDKNRANTEKLLQKVNSLGLKALFVTVDCPAPGKREADERNRGAVNSASGVSGGKVGSDAKGGGVGRTSGAYIDPKLTWDDIAWIRKHTNLPIGVKGLQTVEDCVRAADAGVEAIYISNHGGRALDTAPPALYTLLELRRLRPDIIDKCEIYIDGGVRRGTDVVKALCLGARGCGMGRPFLYALTYGQEGVSHAIEIMRDEIQTTLRLLGVNSLSELGPHLLNTRALDGLVNDKIEFGPKERNVPKEFRK